MFEGLITITPNVTRKQAKRRAQRMTSENDLASNRRIFEGAMGFARSHRLEGDIAWARSALSIARRYAPHCPVLA